MSCCAEDQGINSHEDLKSTADIFELTLKNLKFNPPKTFSGVMHSRVFNKILKFRRLLSSQPLLSCSSKHPN